MLLANYTLFASSIHSTTSHLILYPLIPPPPLSDDDFAFYFSKKIRSEDAGKKEPSYTVGGNVD
jgi:hypothetical protein